jgi:hypothetical protein
VDHAARQLGARTEYPDEIGAYADLAEQNSARLRAAGIDT